MSMSQNSRSQHRSIAFRTITLHTVARIDRYDIIQRMVAYGDMKVVMTPNNLYIISQSFLYISSLIGVNREGYCTIPGG